MGGRLKDSEIAELTAWVKAGAIWPKSAVACRCHSRTTGSMLSRPERRKFWSIQPLAAPPVPKVSDPKWARTDIDRFVLANLEKNSLKPVKLANKHDLIRRATLDLTGLPPTTEETTAFEKDTSPDAFAKVVDRLLASPHYGERWGRIWLDVARYGEDDYRSLNPNPKATVLIPNAYKYRDWVIQAFNDDLPYDQFVLAQLAGDLMDKSVRYKMLPATGFLGLGPWYYDNGSAEVTRADERHDRVDAVTRGFLGLRSSARGVTTTSTILFRRPTITRWRASSTTPSTRSIPTLPRKLSTNIPSWKTTWTKKQKILQEESQSLTNELSRSLALQTANYLEGVYDVTKPRNGTSRKWWNSASSISNYSIAGSSTWRSPPTSTRTRSRGRP